MFIEIVERNGRYRIDVTLYSADYHRKMVEWSHKNCDDVGSISPKMNPAVISFKHKPDALAFKLRWDGYEDQ